MDRMNGMDRPRIKYGVPPCQARGRLLFLWESRLFPLISFHLSRAFGGSWG